MDFKSADCVGVLRKVFDIFKLNDKILTKCDVCIEKFINFNVKLNSYPNDW
ncbi:hypothetical protein SAMN05216324_11917 [Chryseobacterium limigenitum]|uniref:Uncharacterized protein n=1 Tax=Chryseobacterium limigenitum TaxID=1612149 RepID=A0A1K2IVB5_9FLAO|nr:hypothetical protein SAMN05216324_11917 [Chryseobacterium limigenitum]